MDFGTLQERVLELLGRPAVAMAYDLALAELDRTLRIREMETDATLTVSSGSAELPTGFIEFTSVQHVGGLFLTPISPERLASTPATGMCEQYTLTGNRLKLVAPPEDGAQVAVSYYAKLAPLVNGADTNAALQGAIEAFTFAVLANHAALTRDAASAQTWGPLASAAVEAANQAATEARYSGGTITITPMSAPA